MEKYGFVYIWYDRKHKRWYIGCHWGTIDDGYVCSSRWMRNAYRRRPHDFRRRILSLGNMTRLQTFVEEHRWLSMIEDDELGNRYYNLHKHRFGHWSADKDKRLRVDNRASDPEVRAKISRSMQDWCRNRGGCERNRKSAAAAVVALSKKWVVIHPDGREEEVVNLKKFARKYGLYPDRLAKVADGVIKHHKGFRCERDPSNTKRKSQGT